MEKSACLADATTMPFSNVSPLSKAFNNAKSPAVIGNTTVFNCWRNKTIKVSLSCSSVNSTSVSSGVFS